MQKLIVRSTALLVAVASTRASAQDVDTFSASGALFDRQGTLQLAAPRIGAPGSFYAGAAFTYAANPLVAQYEDGTEEIIVGSQLGTRLHGGYNLGGRARLDLELPLYPMVSLTEPTAGLSEPQPLESTFALGDVRLGATVPLLGQDGQGIGVAVAPYLNLPTGSVEAYVSNGGFGGGLEGAAGGGTEGFGWTVDLGVGLGRAAAFDETLSLGNNLHGGAGFHVNITEELLAGTELTAILPFVDGFDPWNKRDVEAHAYMGWLGERGLISTLAVGTGLLAGVGAPDYRVALALGYSTPKVPPDRDGDGLPDKVDRCPTDPEDFDQFEDSDGCPELDNDQDTILDTVDACPLDPEDFDDFEDADGCPEADNDKDGTLDPEDKCPVEPGPKDTHGCPDRDGDRVPDYRDKCPDEPVDSRADPERSDGCPARVVVAKKQIVILDKIYFDFDKATINPVSFPLLDEIAKVMNDNPHIKKIELGGHTDDKGTDSYNIKLSQARVDAVLEYLVTRGSVDRGRLVAVGYGESKPISDNTTEEGRANNRRVEFNILEQE